MKESATKPTKTPFYSSQGQVCSTRQMGSGEGHTNPSGVPFDWELDMGICPVRSSFLGPSWSHFAMTRTQLWAWEPGRLWDREDTKTPTPEKLEATHLHALQVSSSQGDCREWFLSKKQLGRTLVMAEIQPIWDSENPLRLLTIALDPHPGLYL